MTWLFLTFKCSKEENNKTVAHHLSKKQLYYLQDNNKVISRIGGSANGGPTRVALEITITSNDPSKNKKYIDCRQPGFSCSVSINSLTGDKARKISWLDSQVPNVTSQMLKDSILLDTTWEVNFPVLFYSNMRNAILNNSLRLEYNSVDLVVIDNNTEELIYVHKWTDSWSYSTGGAGGTTKKAIWITDPNLPRGGYYSCTQEGPNCVASVAYTKFTDLVGLFEDVFPNNNFKYYVENNLYNCTSDEQGGIKLSFYPQPSSTNNDFYILKN